MADVQDEGVEIDQIPNIPATNLRYGTINTLSQELCIQDTLTNWKHVADKLGFTNGEINGHFANFDGCAPAENMLNEWVFKRSGKIPELVKVFKSLQLKSCLEELFKDEDYKAACKFFQKGNDDNDTDDYDYDDDSSGTSSIVDDSSLPSTSIGTTTSSSLISSGPSSIESATLEQPILKHVRKCKIDEEKEDGKFSQKLECEQKSKCSTSERNSPKSPEKPSMESIIKYSDWPKPDYVRSNSEGATEKIKVKDKRPFSRSFSVESGKKKLKENKNQKKNKRGHFWLKLNWLKRKPLKSKMSRRGSDEVVTVEGHYREEAIEENTNLYPLKEGDIPDSIDKPSSRPSSSGSEDSLPLSPSSPNSLGYESGPELDASENQTKKIYIVCNPGESEIFSKAYDLYLCFCKKGYQCNMFAINFNEVLEIGHYRYEMEQVNKADYLFLCVSEQLKKIFEEPAKNLKGFRDDNSKGLRHVSDFMMSFLAMKCCNKDGKFMPILLDENSDDHIPLFLGNYFRYKWPDQESRMENTIHRRPEFLIPVSSSRVQGTQKVFGRKTTD